MTEWPAPVIRLFLGQMSPAAVLAAADDPDDTKKTNQVCEANYYSGEWALRAAAKDEATRLFRLAASDCPRGFIEWSAANAQLKDGRDAVSARGDVADGSKRERGPRLPPASRAAAVPQ
jgi:lipoprotein NlpI